MHRKWLAVAFMPNKTTWGSDWCVGLVEDNLLWKITKVKIENLPKILKKNSHTLKSFNLKIQQTLHLILKLHLTEIYFDPQVLQLGKRWDVQWPVQLSVSLMSFFEEVQETFRESTEKFKFTCQKLKWQVFWVQQNLKFSNFFFI